MDKVKKTSKIICENVFAKNPNLINQKKFDQFNQMF